MRRLIGSFALCGLFAVLSGCHIAGKCDCDWPGYDNHGHIIAASAIAPVAPSAPAAPVPQPAKETPTPK